MRQQGLRTLLTGLFTGSFVLTASPVYAYLDPGTGSMMLQAAIGAVAGAFVAVRVYWSKIRSVLGGSKRAARHDGTTGAE